MRRLALVVLWWWCLAGCSLSWPDVANGPADAGVDAPADRPTDAARADAGRRD